MEKNKTRTPFGERMWKARTAAKLSQNKVCAAIGISQPTLSELEHDAHGSSYVAAFAQLYKTSALYLSDGKTDNLPIVPSGVEVYSVPTNTSITPVVGKSMGGLPERIFTDEGRGIESYDEYAEIFTNDPQRFIVRVEGNSMYPKYTHGAYALVEPNTEPEIEDDVLIRTQSHGVMLKRLLSKRDGIVLGSYNEKEIYTIEQKDIYWMYYVAYPVPSKKIKNRM